VDLYILFAVHRIVMSAQMAVPKGMSAQMAVLKETIANVVGKRYGAQDVVEEVDDEVINVETSLNQTKEHFEKLKFNFIELQTKSAFVAEIRDYDLASYAATEELPQHKKALQAIKRSNSEAAGEVAQVTGAVALGLAEVRKQEAELVAEVAAIEALEVEHAQLLELISAQQARIGGGGEGGEVVTAEAAVKAALASAAALDQAEAALASSEGTLSGAKVAVETAEKQAAEREEALAATNVTLQEMVAANEARGAKFREQSEWYKETTATFVGLGGTKVRNIQADSIEFDLLVDGQTHSLVVLFEGTLAQSTLKVGAMLNGSESRIEEACAEAVRTNSISMLVFRARALLASTARGA